MHVLGVAAGESFEQVLLRACYHAVHTNFRDEGVELGAELRKAMQMQWAVVATSPADGKAGVRMADNDAARGPHLAMRKQRAEGIQRTIWQERAQHTCDRYAGAP